LVLVFGAFFAGAAALLRAGIPMPTHFDLDEKRRFFEAHKDEYDVVLVGSSATFRNYVPEVIDAELAAEGIEARTFNFGVVGFRSFETDFFIKWILAQRPARLRWMVIEPPSFEPPFQYEEIQQDKTELAVHSHTPEGTQLILRSIWLADVPWQKKVRESVRHLKLCGQNLGNIGRGPAVVLQRLAEEPEGFPAWLSEGRGFQAVEDRPGFQEPDPAKDPLRDREAYRERCIAVERQNRTPTSLERYNHVALERQIAAVRAAGVEPIYCMSPIVFLAPEVLSLGKADKLPNLLALHLPQTYRDLFRPEERIDATHYRRVGAEKFSRFFAAKLAEILRRKAP
jgi:hypothetical protein